MDRERFEAQRDFILEVDKLKFVERRTHLRELDRPENDAEHSWHIALMAYLLQEYANEDINIAHTMAMLLSHDLVEIEAGDTYAYAAERANAHEREAQAADKLYSHLPEDQAAAMRALWDEYEENETPEARFARAMDILEPMLLCYENGGREWRINQVARSQTGTRADEMRRGSEELAGYVDELLDKACARGDLRDA